jgi:hypothetical protein
MRASWLKERGLRDEYWQGCVVPTDSGLREAGRWSLGPSYDVDGRVTPSETLVALARGSGVSLIRFYRLDSLQLELLSDINAGGLMKRVAVRDTLLYVGSTAGLEVWNIADERNPARLSWLHTALNDFDVQDTLAYIIGADDSFKVYNVSDPVNPVFRGSCRDSGDLVSVAGNTAFVGDRWGLYAVDITNPAGPHRIGAWGSAIEQVLARGTLCYVTTFNPNQPGEITFHVLDVSMPGNPVQIGAKDSAGGLDVHLIDTLAFCSGDNYMDKFRIVSVADPTRPYVIGSVGSGGWGFGIWASGLAQTTFVGSHWQGLQVFDTRSSSEPIWETSLLGADQAVDVCVDNGRAYVADEMAGLKILDISTPAGPHAIGTYDSAGQMPFMHSAVAHDSFAYVRWGIPPFRTVDVSDPASPRYAGGVDIFNPPQDMVIRDSFVYIAEVNRFQIVNVARPREPVLVGSCAGDGVAVVVQDTFAYTSAGVTRIMNVARPASPYIAGTISGRSATGLAVRDTFLYLPYAYDTLFTYSVANPAQPRVLSAVQTGVWPHDVVLGDSIAYVALSDGFGVEVFSLADPGRPARRGRASAASGIRRLQYVDGRLYAAMWEAGVAIYETTTTSIGEPAAPKPRTSAFRVWPNVTTGNVRLTASGTPQDLDVAVYDISGSRLGNVPLQATMEGGATEYRLNLSGLPAGVYLVRVDSEGKKLTAKVVRTKGR